VATGSSPESPGPKSAHDFIGLLYCFIVLLCICVVSCPYVIYRPTVMARYSLFVLKVPLNTKQTNKQNLLTCSRGCTAVDQVNVSWHSSPHSQRSRSCSIRSSPTSAKKPARSSNVFVFTLSLSVSFSSLTAVFPGGSVT